MIYSYAWGKKIINDNFFNKNAEMHNSFAILEVSSLFTLYITHISGVGHTHYQNMFHIQGSNSINNILCCYAYIAYSMTDIDILYPTIVCDLYFFWRGHFDLLSVTNIFVWNVIMVDDEKCFSCKSCIALYIYVYIYI